MLDNATSKRLREFYIQRGMLLKVHMDLLYACDLDCRHCYLEDKKRPQVDGTLIVDVLRQAADLGAMDLLFSGGEIFLRKDLLDLISAARELKYRVRLKTHGGRLTAYDARRLRELGVSQVDFSVYSLDADVHDEFTKVPGSLERTLQGISLVAEEGIKVAVKTHVTGMNRHSYQALHTYFTSRGIETTVNAQIRGTNTGNTSTYPLNVTFEDKVQLELFKIALDGQLADRPEPLPPDEARLCMAGVTSLYVTPDLKVTPCSAFPMDVGDLRVQSLREIWETSPAFAELRVARRKDVLPCNTCEARKFCSYCAGAAYIESGGDWKTPPEIICKSAFAAMDAAERYGAGERASPAAPPVRRKLGAFAIRASHGPVPAQPHGGCSC